MICNCFELSAKEFPGLGFNLRISTMANFKVASVIPSDFSNLS